MPKHLKAAQILGLLFALCLLGSARALADGIAGSFSIINGNPNGAWTYGSLSGSTFTPFTLPAALSGTSGYWTTSGFPEVIGNNTGAYYNSAPSSTWDLPNDMLLLHPDSNGIESDVRWTAPSAGLYSIAGLFEGLDFVYPTTTDVHILLNGSSLFSDNISTYHVPSNFSLVESLNSGDTIDFAVGYGTDGNYFGDSTGLTGSITSTPEPATFLLVGTAFAAMSLRRKRKSGPISA
jgi:hypothetical protein